MKIGWDLDGCIAEINIPILRLLDTLRDTHTKMVESAEDYYYASLKVKYNPFDFCAPKDEVIIVTARLTKYLELSQKWVYNHFGRPVKIHAVGKKQYMNVCDQLDLDRLFRETAEAKLKVLLDEEIEVYFDDNPEAILQFRSMTDKIKFIQVGQRIIG